MRPVEMDRTGMLAAAMYSILDDRRFNKRLGGFSVRVELEPGLADDEVLLGDTISGHIQIDSIRRKEFEIVLIHDGDYGNIKVIVPYRTEHYQTYKPIAHINAKGPIEIDFDKRNITFIRVHTLSTKNVAWDWASVKGTALDIIGMILGEKDSD
jgi:hypothetical protein